MTRASRRPPTGAGYGCSPPTAASPRRRGLYGSAIATTNGVIELCAHEQAVFAEIRGVLRPGGLLLFAGIADGRPVPPEVVRDIDLWTGCIAGGLAHAGGHEMLDGSGFGGVEIGRGVGFSAVFDR